MDIKQKLKLYFDYEIEKKDTKQKISDLEAEKDYAMETVKAMTITDMPKAHNGCKDISDCLDNCEFWDNLIRGQIRKLELLESNKIEIEEMLKGWTIEDLKALKCITYGFKITYMCRDINTSYTTAKRIRKRLYVRIGI
jgi:hypothetical protein